jgi:hypothetical protein
VAGTRRPGQAPGQDIPKGKCVLIVVDDVRNLSAGEPRARAHVRPG